MKKLKDQKRFEKNWQAESEAVFLYEKLAQNESNPSLKQVYEKLAGTEKKHAALWAEKLMQIGRPPKSFKPGIKTSILAFLARRVGSASVIPLIATIERNASAEYAGQPDVEVPNLAKEEDSHSRVFQFLAKNNTVGVEGSEVARFEGRHKTGGNALRAGVLGANDGLVSVFCIVMGVAGAGVASHTILITGVAGLLACALSMALGEWLSVQNARELYKNQIRVESQELDQAPEEEKEELTLIYQSKGVSREHAENMVNQIFQNKETALDTLVREELAIDPQELGGSAWTAAITSFFLCLIGGIVPVFPYFFLSGTAGIIGSSITSAIGLLLLGLLSAFVTGSNPIKSAIRQILFGIGAAGVTFGIGLLVGTHLG